MLITVIYQDDKKGIVEASSLDDLISQKKIKKFLRSDGWCTIGVDRLRAKQDARYKGNERRGKTINKSQAKDIDSHFKEDSQEKRQHQRYYIYDHNINIEIDCANEVEVVDMSLGGISLKTDIQLQAGNQYILRLKRKGNVIAVRGDVKWSSLSEYKKYIVHNKLFPIFHNGLIPIYSAGIQFKKVSDEQLAEIMQLIYEHGYKDLDLNAIRHYHDLLDLSEYLEGMSIFEQKDAQVQEASNDIRRKSIAEKRKTALFCGKEERSVLLKDPNKEVVLTTIENPKITEIEIAGFAKMPTIPVEAIKRIVQKKVWMKNYTIVLALVNNPKTPAYISTRLVKRLKTRDLKILEKNRDVSEAVRRIAKNRVYSQV
jgi:hypothetical protein